MTNPDLDNEHTEPKEYCDTCFVWCDELQKLGPNNKINVCSQCIKSEHERRKWERRVHKCGVLDFHFTKQKLNYSILTFIVMFMDRNEYSLRELVTFRASELIKKKCFINDEQLIFIIKNFYALKKKCKGCTTWISSK